MPFEALHFTHGTNVKQFEHLIASSTQNPIAVLVPLDCDHCVLVCVTVSTRSALQYTYTHLSSHLHGGNVLRTLRVPQLDQIVFAARHDE